MVQGVGQLAQLDASLGDLMSALGILVSGIVNVDDAAVELFGHRVLLFGGGGDQGIHIGDTHYGTVDGIDTGTGIPRQTNALLHL